jgi:Kef-type K+ transport system membrane component KefB
MIVLALSVGVYQNSGTGLDFAGMLPIIKIIIIACIFIVIGAYIGSKVFGQVIMIIESKTGKASHAGFLFALAIMFLYAYIAELIGISAIVGAFVAGTMFSSVPIKKEFDDGAKFLATVFTPIFFITIGIMVNFSGLNGFYFVGMGIVLALIAIFTKVIGCSIPAKATGMTTRESLIVGYGMTPRCEVALIIAMLGLSLGIIGQGIYFMAIMVAVLTTILTPPALKMLLADNKRGMKKKDLIAKLSTGSKR